MTRNDIFKTPIMRLTITLVVLMVNLLFLANLIGFVPDKTKSTLELRKGLTESLAIQFSVAADRADFQTIQSVLREVVERNKDIRSAAIRTVDGKLIALAGEHLAHWKPPVDGKSTPTHVHVSVFRKGKKWATVEIRFAPLWTNRLASGFTHSFTGLLMFIGSSSFICFFFVIKRTMRELDPSTVIPDRVQKAFDVLQEGVLILDEKEQIVMANTFFAGFFDKKPHDLVGLKGSELGWLNYNTRQQIKQLPWCRVLKDGLEQKGASIQLLNRAGHTIKLAVNATMVTDNAGKCRGSLVTFDDITQLEEKNFELSNLVEKLQITQGEIQTKSMELEFLANHDPLTLCLNRRSLDRNLNILFTKAKAEKRKLSCLMVDIDHFKLVNDRYGHATGDQIIKVVTNILKNSTRDNDLVGRYGGEEFCVIMPELTQEQAAQIAERIRQRIEEKAHSGVKITISLGVSSLEHNANKPDELVNQADKALYTAKQSGRNRVIKWGDANLQPMLQGNDTKSSLPQSSQLSPEQEIIALQNRVKELEAQLEKRTIEFNHHTMYDHKTGLPTRSLFEDRLDREIARCRRKEYLVVVMDVGINTIKRIEETLGHMAAAQLIKLCGHRLHDVLRENIDTVAVIGESEKNSSVSQINQTEFGILLTDISQISHVTWVIKRLQEAFAKPFHVEGHKIFTSPYIGVSIFPHDGETAEDLYSSAANACSYVEKINGNDRYQFASPEINDLAKKHLLMESCLHTAIENNELQLHFQPQITTATGRIAGFEALLRWQSAQLGSVPPDQFIPIAEQSGQIDEIGDWVLYRTCKQLREWLDEGLTIPSIAVNLSGIQLRQRNLAKKIAETLDEFKLGPHQIELELTESSLVNTYDKSFTVLHQIKDLGIRITMDDFGTGYSSLAYLKDIPLSCIKIDRSFTANIGKNRNVEKLIASIISMAHGLELEVVAEGVEEQKQADYLAALGCEYLQGYLFSRPIPGPDIIHYLATQRTTVAGDQANG